MHKVMATPRILSLFSGAGGLDIGFHSAGFKIVACVEIDKASCETLKLNKGRYVDPDCLIINEDITKLEPASLNLGKIDFIIGGPPCQSFSAAGRRAGGVTGVNDTRGSLFWYYCKFLEHFKPRGFLFENVRGILQANNSQAWQIIKESFSKLGYELHHRILDAADYGVPQHRERLILVGTRKQPFYFPRPTHGPDSKDQRSHFTVGEAFADIDDPHEVVPPYGGKYGDLLPAIPPGLNYLFYTEKMGHPTPKFAWRSKFSGFLYKVDPRGLSKTLVAHQGRYDGPFHWRGRKLTIRELKRIQGFPDDYVFIDSKVEASKQIGNAVAPRFAIVLAKAVMNQFFQKRFPEICNLTDDDKLGFDKRKGEKAHITKRLVITGTKSMNQLGLFCERVEQWPNSVMRDKITYKDEVDHIAPFSRTFKLKKGCWDIAVKREHIQKSEKCKIGIKVEFTQVINKSFDRIFAGLETDTLWDISCLWDSIHYCVSKSSSYEHLQPLYGHFTEPYPKFTIDIEIDGKAPVGLGEWIKGLCNYDYLSQLHDLSILEPANDSVSNVIDFVKKLRKHRFDIRVNETNRTIPQGYFRVCYPFTIYNIEKTYVMWHERGQHKTGDIRIIKTENGYEPKKALDVLS